VQWAALDKECGESFAKPGKGSYTDACQALLTKASTTAGKFYVYDIYDTCGADQMKSSSKSTGTLQELEEIFKLGQPGAGPGTEPAYSPYGCGKNRVTEIYLNLPEVSKPPSALVLLLLRLLLLVLLLVLYCAVQYMTHACVNTCIDPSAWIHMLRR
jgi:hypothetical protein